MEIVSGDLNINFFIKNDEESKLLSKILLSDDNLDFNNRLISSMNFDGVFLPNHKITIGVVEYISRIDLQSTQSRNYTIMLPIEGSAKINVNDVDYHLDDRTAIITSPKDNIKIKTLDTFKFYIVSIPEEKVIFFAKQLTKLRTIKKVVFDKIMPTYDEKVGELWWDNIFTFISNKYKYRNFYAVDTIIVDYENYVIKSLILTQENDYSEYVTKSVTDHAPNYIKIVKKYIIENAQAKFTITDLQNIAGVSKTKLFNEFYHYYGMTPMNYLKKYRLHKVHDALKNDNASNISQLAYEWGFNHLSRFSLDYREEFGENPIDTRKKIKSSLKSSGF